VVRCTLIDQDCTDSVLQWEVRYTLTVLTSNIVRVLHLSDIYVHVCCCEFLLSPPLLNRFVVGCNWIICTHGRFQTRYHSRLLQGLVSHLGFLEYASLYHSCHEVRKDNAHRRRATSRMILAVIRITQQAGGS
jgi:hypothetical protein